MKKTTKAQNLKKFVVALICLYFVFEPQVMIGQPTDSVVSTNKSNLFFKCFKINTNYLFDINSKNYSLGYWSPVVILQVKGNVFHEIELNKILVQKTRVSVVSYWAAANASPAGR